MSGPGLSLHVPEPHNERLLDFILERRSALSTIELACGYVISIAPSRSP